MPDAKFKGVLVSSSEDKNYPATNLLNGSKKKWKCEETGLDNVYVILQFEKPTKISGIDIGNEHSAFVEVSVGRAGWPHDKYKTLLMNSSLMTIIESRASENPNHVRCFAKDQLVPDIAEEKWEFIKFTCIQTFNRQVQYGLSFVTVHTPNVIASDSAATMTASPKEKKKCDEALNLPKTSVFSQFRIRGDSTDSDNQDSESSSLFMKWKEKNSPVKDPSNSTNNLSAAAAIRDASSSISKLKECTKINHTIETPTGKTKRPAANDKDAKKERINRNRAAIMYDDEDENTSKPKLEKLINDDKERIERERIEQEKKKGKKDSSREEKSKNKMNQSAEKFKAFLQPDFEDKADDAADTKQDIEQEDDDCMEIKQTPDKIEVDDSSDDDGSEKIEKKKSPEKLAPESPQPSRSKSPDPSTPPAWIVKKKRPSSSTDSSASKRNRISDSDDDTDDCLRGVTFVISGIQNPDRADLRSKGIEMGARYQPDWNASCTHLICAFKNTPKYKQVKGSGIIVNKDWIVDCHAQKKKLPWQDYQL